MKLHYFLEYFLDNKGYRSDLGYSIFNIRAAALAKLQAGAQNVVILPVLEESNIMSDEDNINIIDVDCEVRLDDVPKYTEPKKPN